MTTTQTKKSATKFAAFIETKIEGVTRTIPVFPRSRKTSLFTSREKAGRAIECRARGVVGRGLVFDADGRAFSDRVAEYTIAL